MKVERSIYPQLTYLERMRGFYSHLAETARILVRAAAEKPKPNANVCANIATRHCPRSNSSYSPLIPSIRIWRPFCWRIRSAEMQEALGKDDPEVQKVLNGKTPAEAAKDLIANTKLDDVAVRKQLYEGGQAAIDASTDPLIVVMRNVDPSARAVRKQYDDKVDSVVRRDGTLIAKARFAQSGFNQPPDATFTLRLSYGAVKGYTENGKTIPFDTNIGGAFEHAADHGDQPPYDLPTAG